MWVTVDRSRAGSSAGGARSGRGRAVRRNRGGENFQRDHRNFARSLQRTCPAPASTTSPVPPVEATTSLGSTSASTGVGIGSIDIQLVVVAQEYPRLVRQFVILRRRTHHLRMQITLMGWLRGYDVDHPVPLSSRVLLVVSLCTLSISSVSTRSTCWST